MSSDPFFHATGTESVKRSKLRHWLFPLSVFFVLLAVTVVAGTIAYILTEAWETQNFEKDYYSLVTNSAILLQRSLYNRAEGVSTMSLILSIGFPDARDWPFAYLFGYDQISKSLNGQNAVANAPIVYPSPVERFERFAYQAYNSTYSEPVAQSSFGEGIFAVQNTSNFNEGRYHDATGNTTYGSDYQLLAPVLQGNRSKPMFNFHSEELRGRYMDRVIGCAKNVSNTCSIKQCGVMTAPTTSLVSGKMASIIIDTVYPAYNTSTLVGFTIGFLHWDDIISEIISLFVTGMRCVLRTDNVTYTFALRDGKVSDISEGDHHDSKYDAYALIMPVDLGNELRAVSSSYTLTIYPSDQFISRYRKGSPVFVTVIVVIVLVMLFVLITCSVYFTWVRRRAAEDATQGQETLREIRSPLNTLSLGLNLLLTELSQTISPTPSSATTDTHLLPQPPSAAHRAQCSEWRKLVAEMEKNSQCAVLLLDDLLSFEQLEDSEADDPAAPATGQQKAPAHA